MPAIAATVAPPTTAATAAPQTFQQQFDAGAAAMQARDWPQAEAIYAALETRLLARTPSPKSLTIVQLRKGIVQYYQDKSSDAEANIKAALAKIDMNDAALRADRALGSEALGALAARHFDYPGAVSHYRDALKLEENAGSRLQTLVGLVTYETFVDPSVALSDIDAGIATVSGKDATAKATMGVLRDIRGRVLLNLGRTREARAEFTTAIKLLGGLESRKFDLNDATVRADGAMAALLDHDDETAKKLLAYTNAGEQAEQGFRASAAMSLPECGGKNGPKPSDVAVIQLNIQDDGSVGSAVPIYYSGNPATAVNFAKEVADWYWRPEELSKMDKFYRYQTRVELRCTTVFNRPNAFSLISSDMDSWYKANAGNFLVSDETPVDEIKSELSRREAAEGKDSPKLLTLLSVLIDHYAIPREQSEKYALRAFQIAKTANVPAAVKVYYGLFYWSFLDQNLKLRKNPLGFQNEITLALTDPQISADVNASGALRIALFDSFNAATRATQGPATLQPLVDDPSRKANDPIRVGALVRLANLEYAAGNLDGARASFAKSGLSAQQCALVGAVPAIKAGNITSSDYPDEALRWGLAGWTMIEFDIAADGQTLNQRPVLAWPPFVFGDLTAAGIRKFRYEQSYRPEGGLGCGGQRQTVRYAIPKG